MMSTLKSSEMSPEIVMRGIIKRRDVHPTAKLIKFRFGSWYDGKVTKYELDRMKEQMEKAEKVLCDYKKEIYDERMDYKYKIGQQKELCGEECVKKLDEHMKVCERVNGENKCTKDFISYDCQLKSNGRCSHFYEKEELEAKLAFCDETIYNMSILHSSLSYNYERQIAIQENRYDMFCDEDEF